MILVGFRGSETSHPWVRTLLGQIAAGEVGGVMFMAHNIVSQPQVKALNDALRSANPALAPFRSVDQEGGRVQRLMAASGFAETPSAADVARNMSLDEAYRAYRRMAAGLADWGFDLNFGPVVDLNRNPANPVIAILDRAYSVDPRIVVDYAAAFVRAHREHAVISTLKHFPGHGSGTVDSHRMVADLSSTWSDVELEPYRNLIGQGLAEMVMVGHIHVRTLDPAETRRPASLSPEVIGGVLRGQLGFAGLVVTDDLQMDAVWQNYSFEDAVVRAVRAGNNLLLFSNYDRPEIDIPGKVIAALKAAAANDPQVLANIDRSYELIVAAKGRLIAGR